MDPLTIGLIVAGSAGLGYLGSQFTKPTYSIKAYGALAVGDGAFVLANGSINPAFLANMGIAVLVIALVISVAVAGYLYGKSSSPAPSCPKANTSCSCIHCTDRLSHLIENFIKQDIPEFMEKKEKTI